MTPPTVNAYWWTPVDAKAFEERAACFVDQYSEYTAIDEVKRAW